MSARLPGPAHATSRLGFSRGVPFLLLEQCPQFGKSEVAVYCEHCGLRILPERQVCTRCGKSPSYEWIQLTSLLVILLAVIGNEVTGWLVLPRITATHPAGHFFRTWLWVDRQTSVYGWMPLAAGMLIWEFYVWRKVRKAKPVTKIRSWISRKILTFVLAAGFAPILPWWIPAGQPSEKTMATLALYPGLPCAISWGAILIVATVLCCKAETRNLLLGNGKVLSLVSLGALAMFMALTLVGWSLT